MKAYYFRALIMFISLIPTVDSFNRHLIQVSVLGFRPACMPARIYLLENISRTETWKYKKKQGLELHKPWHIYNMQDFLETKI